MKIRFRNYGFLLFFLTNILFFAQSPIIKSETMLLNRHLELGAKGPDVFILQTILNKSEETKIANSGPGSPGFETDYFGILTKKAVERFQNIYKSEILFPSNLLNPTGYVGEATLRKLNSVFLSDPTNGHNEDIKIIKEDKNFVSKNPVPINFGENNFVHVFSVFPYRATPGDSIKITGSGFGLDENIVTFNNLYPISKLRSEDGSTIITKIPDNIPFGAYDIAVSNKYKKNGISYAKAKVLVSDKSLPPPSIKEVTPSSNSLSDTITIYGSGFLKEGNNIFSSLGEIKNLPSSDGKTIKVSISSFPFANKLKGPVDVSGLDVAVYLYVQNDNGVQSEPSVFYIRL